LFHAFKSISISSDSSLILDGWNSKTIIKKLLQVVIASPVEVDLPYAFSDDLFESDFELGEDVEVLFNDFSASPFVHQDTSKPHAKHRALKRLRELVCSTSVQVQLRFEHGEDFGGDTAVKTIVNLLSFPRF